MMSEQADQLVEIKPEVVFLYEVLQELTSGHIRIPRFQRAFVWRPDQMTELLDSINRQYPIGSLLVWETTEEIATLDRLGPFERPPSTETAAGYLLDGHQRLMTLAGALLPGSEALHRTNGLDSGKWEMFWNVERRRFQHMSNNDDDEFLFPMSALLDTVLFFEHVEEMRARLGTAAPKRMTEVSELARTFQSYRVPVVRIRKTGLSEAVEIFARLNSKGQSMTPDQMVSALTFRQPAQGTIFDLSTELDQMVESISERGFGELDRTTLLRCVLACLDEDIYRTDWTRLAKERRDVLQGRLTDAVGRATTSVERALSFLEELGVTTGRLLPYQLQLVLLSAFFDRCSAPSSEQVAVLRRWFWVSSFSAWFGGANPSRISALIREFREHLAVDPTASTLENFALDAEALPFPTNFDMRSARTRTLLLVMLDAMTDEERDHAVDQLAVMGPGSVGSILGSIPREVQGTPANRLFRPRGSNRGLLRSWVIARDDVGDSAELARYGVDAAAVTALRNGDALAFVRARQAALTAMETTFQAGRDVSPSVAEATDAPVDTE